MNTDTTPDTTPVRHPEWRVTRRTSRGSGVFVPAPDAIRTPTAWVRGLLSDRTHLVPIEERQGHYVEAATAEEAAIKVATKFPGEREFDVQPWKDASRCPIENRKPVYVHVGRGA